MDPLCRLGARECGGRHTSRAELREDNLWLAQQLAVSESNARLWQERVQQLRSHVRELEEKQRRERAAWEKEAKAREREWRGEYERQMQPLLQIVVHHEETRRQLKEDMESLRKERDAAVATKQRVAIVADATTQTGDSELIAVREACEERYQNAKTCDGSCREDAKEAGDVVTKHGSPELVAPDGPLSIHEQYVSLTMQKLLEQLRMSNQQTTSNFSTGPSESPTDRLSFRDMIRERLASNPKPSVGISSPQFEQHGQIAFKSNIQRPGFQDRADRRISMFNKLPAVKEEDTTLSSLHQRLSSSAA